MTRGRDVMSPGGDTIERLQHRSRDTPARAWARLSTGIVNAASIFDEVGFIGEQEHGGDWEVVPLPTHEVTVGVALSARRPTSDSRRYGTIWRPTGKRVQRAGKS